MTEKRVSVRLVAVGGRQVRAELEGVGTAGARGFGRLSSEMELANARLAAFARRASIAMAALGAAAAAAGVAMVRSGLDTIGAQADLAASLGTTVESLQVLTWAGELAGVSLGEIEQATKKLTTRLSEAAAGSGTAVGALERLGLTAEGLQDLPLDDRLISIQEALARMVPAAERAGVAADLFGDRAALALLRIDPATLREAAVDIRDFGVAVSTADAAQIERTGDALARLQLIGLGLTNRLTAAVAPALEATANALADITRGTGPLGRALDGLIANLGRLGTQAATFATLMAGRWVAAMAAAALSMRGLATALVFLRGALIRTGIGALVVGAGELVYQFTRLAAGAGSVGEAFRLLGALGREVFDRMGLGLKVTFAQMSGDWEGLKAAGLAGLDGTIAGVVAFGDRTAAVFQGAYDAAVAIWGKLPGAIGDFAFQAANGLISGIEAMLNGVVTQINGFISALNGALELLPDWAVDEGGVRIGTLDPLALGRIANPFEGGATAAGTAAADAFAAALAGTYLAAPDTGLGAAADAARSRAEGYREAAGMLVDAAARPLASWQALRDAMAGAGSDADVALGAGTDAAAALGDELDAAAAAGRGAGAAAREAGDAATGGAEVALTGWQAVTAALADYAAKARDIGGDVGQTLVGAFSSAEQAVGDFVRTGKLGMRDLVTSVIADLAQLAARRFVLGPLAGALAGALGGGGGLGAAGSVLAPVLHDGGTVGAAGPGRMVPALAFAGAPRMHGGGWAGLRPDEVPAILQRGERVLSRREVAVSAGRSSGAEPVVAITINARDVESFRQSQTQVAADIARAIARGRRGM
jgi:hypothetical protein